MGYGYDVRYLDSLATIGFDAPKAETHRRPDPFTEVDTTRPHYILWNPESTLPPTVRFGSWTDARDAAEVMARRFPKNTFHICKVIGGARTAETPVEVKMLETPKAKRSKK